MTKRDKKTKRQTRQKREKEGCPGGEVWTSKRWSKKRQKRKRQTRKPRSYASSKLCAPTDRPAVKKPKWTKRQEDKRDGERDALAEEC